MQLEQDSGKDCKYISSIPAKLSFLAGPGKFSQNLRKVGSHLASPLYPSPTIPSPAEWSIKNTMFTAQQLLLAATAYGLETSPMEGFDESRLIHQFDIPPERYNIPLVIALGNHPEGMEDNTIPDITSTADLKEKARYPLETICFENRYRWKAIFD